VAGSGVEVGYELRGFQSRASRTASSPVPADAFEDIHHRLTEVGLMQ
jgi:hypothetical protein